MREIEMRLFVAAMLCFVMACGSDSGGGDDPADAGGQSTGSTDGSTDDTTVAEDTGSEQPDIGEEKQWWNVDAESSEVVDQAARQRYRQGRGCGCNYLVRNSLDGHQ
jgi:hypothetical protein